MNAAFSKSDGASAPRQIRFVHNQGQPPSKRRRINAACLTCRRRKTRCDGERPICTTCSKNGHKCLGYPEDIKREGVDPQDTKLDDIDDVNETAQLDNDGEHKPTYAPEASNPPEPPRYHDPSSSTGHSSTDSRLLQSPRESKSRLAVPTIERPDPSPSLSNSRPPQTASTDDSNDIPSSPTLYRAQNLSHRIPYFRYFGPTAIVPGFKQMVVSVRDRRMSASGSHSATSPQSTPSGAIPSGSAPGSDVVVEELPSYDPNSTGPVPPLIIHLVKTFFLHVGCNFPFLKESKFLRMVKEKRVESILVDAICAIAARFSDVPALTGGNDKMPRTERGQIFAHRAKQATVDTFPCPSVAAVQAFLLLAYEGFGANQDSALWMYLGLAIRMAMDLGLQKRVGIKYQGEKDPWNTRQRSRAPGDPDSPEERRREDSDYLTVAEQKELEQERIDTFWAVFVLDRIISSGTGRPVTFRDDDFELPFPETSIDPNTGWPTLFPVLVQIIHLYGRVSDVLNNIHNAQDLTQDKWTKLTSMEHQLTRLYKGWNAQLQFSVNNFKAYLNIGQGNIFILFHLWFHALFIILHQPTLLTPFGELRSELQLLSDSRELSMSSAKTICDILAFADLIDPKSFIGNPFTSQPIYIAGGAFLMESSANASRGPSPQPSPEARKGKENGQNRHSRHSLLASAASQNYQRCYNSLQQINNYWGGIKYILTALDQKAKGTRDVETYTTEEYESTKAALQPRGSISGQLARLNSPKAGGPPIAWSLSGTANSPNSSLTLMYQTGNGSVVANGTKYSQAIREASTPPGNMVYDPIRQSLPEASGMYPPAVPQPNVSALRHSPHQQAARRAPNMPTPNGQPSSIGYEGVSDNTEASKMFVQHPGYTPTSQHSGGYDAYSGSPASGMGENPASTGSTGMYYANNMPYSQGAWGAPMGNMDITFNSQDIDIGALGLNQPDLMGGWLDYIPNDMLGLFDSPEMNQSSGAGSGGGPGSS